MRAQRRFGGPYKGLSPCPNKECRSDGHSERVRPRVFSLSLGDWLDPEVPIEWLADLLALIQATPNLDWLLVTKRPELFRQRMEHVFGFEICENPAYEPCRLQLAWDWHHGKEAPANVWLGASVENQKAAYKRIPYLLQIPARVRFLSCEPLLGPVDLCDWYDHKSGDACVHPLDGYVSSDGFYHPWVDKNSRIHWVICGGESGPNARPIHPDWARSLRDQCVAAGVPFFFKQWGEWQAVYDRDQDPDWRGVEQVKTTFPKGRWVNLEGWHGFHGEHVHWMVPAGKKKAGRLLDGRKWNELPETRP